MTSEFPNISREHTERVDAIGSLLLQECENRALRAYHMPCRPPRFAITFPQMVVEFTLLPVLDSPEQINGIMCNMLGSSVMWFRSIHSTFEPLLALLLAAPGDPREILSEEGRVAAALPGVLAKLARGL